MIRMINLYKNESALKMSHCYKNESLEMEKFISYPQMAMLEA